MRYLIVNGDDFGASAGINRGVVEAHGRGILTSASLMVDMPASEDAARRSRDLPRLSVGLHVDLTGRDDPDDCRAELNRQFRRFQELTGGPPTHLDAHHNAHRDPRLLPAFLELARECRLPLREHSPVRSFPKFYGRWDGVTHLEQVSLASLVRMLETEVPEGCTELSCHPGYVDPGFASGYAAEREAELRTLCEPSLRAALARRQIRLINFRDFARLQAGSPA
jgi:chitin disaccharide deacetylase